jgi:predicted phosphoribosyltransferase
MRFRDRRDAGRSVVARVAQTPMVDPLVLGLPRGGVPVAAEVAAALHAPLDVVIARKVGAPGHPEFGIGAISEGGVRVADRATLRRLDISDDVFARLAAREEPELLAQVERYRSGRELPLMQGRDVVVVDDGLATGVTAEAALRFVRKLEPARLILAEPVCAQDTARRLADVADVVVCAHEPASFHAVGAWYEDFDATSDDQVVQLLDARRHGSADV